MNSMDSESESTQPQLAAGAQSGFASDSQAAAAADGRAWVKRLVRKAGTGAAADAGVHGLARTARCGAQQASPMDEELRHCSVTGCG